MIRTILTSILMLWCTFAYADNRNTIEKLKQLINKDSAPADKMIVDRYRTPQSEVEDAIVFLSQFRAEDAQFVRFFSTYAVEPQDRNDLVLTLSFVIHSLVGVSDEIDEGNAGGYYPLAIQKDGEFIPYRKVPNSDTLWWIDLREYNWTAQAWETVSAGDGYFAEPIVSYDRSGALRLLSGNAVLRADWFIFHVMSSVQQADLGNDNDFYSTLLYALVDAPENIDEFRRIWGLDINEAKQLGNEYGTLVTKSNAVTRHNRMLFGYRTDLGYLYETYDVLNELGRRDYLETLFLNDKPGEPPEVSDAGEAFATNALGMQVYALRNAAGDLVDFGDPTAVRHFNDVIGDARVSVAYSCVDCHAVGPLPAENTLQELIDARVDLRVYDIQDSLRINRSLLSNRFRDSISSNQEIFAKALKKVNGLTPSENGRLYLKAISRYFRPLTLERAAYECGMDVNSFVGAIMSKNVNFGARLKLLIQNNEDMQRDSWESPGVDGIPGLFQQAMIIINGLTIISDDVEETIEIDKKVNDALIESQGSQRFDVVQKKDELAYEDKPYIESTKKLTMKDFDLLDIDNYRIQPHKITLKAFIVNTSNIPYKTSSNIARVFRSATYKGQAVYANTKQEYTDENNKYSSRHYFVYNTRGKRLGYIDTRYLDQVNK